MALEPPSVQVTNQQLMRVYGALMWSLGKVVKTPEVLRVYIGSFWDREYQIKENKSLFEAEQNDLLADLRSLPRNSSVRKVNELVKRARCAKVRYFNISIGGHRMRAGRAHHFSNSTFVNFLSLRPTVTAPTSAPGARAHYLAHVRPVWLLQQAVDTR